MHKKQVLLYIQYLLFVIYIPIFVLVIYRINKYFRIIVTTRKLSRRNTMSRRKLPLPILSKDVNNKEWKIS